VKDYKRPETGLYCPLMTSTIEFEGKTQLAWTRCVKDECGWWNAVGLQCSIKTIAESLEAIDDWRPSR
jgi:hypothetical protein